MAFAAPYFVTLAALGALAALLDVAQRRLPNLLSATIAGVGLLAQLVTSGASGALSGVVAGTITAALLWPLWRMHGIGGGDLKLAAAFAISAGLGRLPTYALAAALAGGAVSFFYYLASPRPVRRAIRTSLGWSFTMSKLPEVSEKRAQLSVPYGVGIVAGALFALAVTVIR